MEINYLKNKRGLFVFSDPGGAKPILGLITLIKKNLKDFRIVSDRTYSFFKEFDFDVNKPNINYDIDNFNPDFIFTGTSYTSKIELEYIEKSKIKNIVSYSFVDHYSDISNRFLNNGKLVLPSVILVIDEHAKKIAISESLPIEKIKILSNPYQEFLRKWKPNISKKEFLLKNNILSNNYIIYAPDPLSNNGGIKKFGNDENNILKMIVKSLEGFNDILLIIKPHPNQDIEFLINNVEFNNTKYKVVDDIQVNDLIFYSKVVIGIFSNFLIESKILNKDIIRITKNIKLDHLKKRNIGTVCKNEKELKKALQIL